jgi:glyoxylase-like metal-dependent hydrolase (beta-lactamase superfamily II)
MEKAFMIEISEFGDIVQIKMSREIDGRAIYWVSAYLVDGLLIDTGCRYTAEEFALFLTRKKLHMVVNTHFHEDHIGGNHLIKNRFPLNIFAHPESIPFIIKPPKLFPYQELVWGYPDPAEVMPIQDIIKTDHFTFEVIKTPGHSVGHIALFERTRGWCFTGDLFARENPKFIRPEEDMGETAKSMANIANLKTDRLTLFTSIGRIIEDGRHALLSCIHYLEDLSKKTKKLESRRLSIQEIVKELFGGEHPFAQLTNGQYTAENLVRSVLLMD